VESFNFELKLISDVDRVANRGVAPLRKLEAQSKKTQEALNFHKPLERVEQQLARLNRDPAGFVKMKKAQKELAEQQKKLLEGAGLARGEGFLSAMTSKMSFTKLASAAAVGDIVGEGIMKAGESLFELAHKFADVIKEGLEHAFEEAGKQQVLRVGERLSLRGGAGEFREDVNRFSKLTGFDDDNIRQMLLPMRRAGMGQQGVRSAFAAASDVAAGEGRGGDQGRVQELLSGFEHIFLKGGVQERLLPSLGVAVKPFYADLAKQLHVSADVAKKRAEEGRVDPQLLLNTIYRGIEKKQGGKLGTGAIEYSKTFEARMARVKNLPNEYLKALVDSPNFQKASDMMAGLLEKLDPESPAGRRIQGALEGMFDKITAFIGDPEDTAEKLSAALEQGVNLFGEAVDAAKSLADALLPSLETIEDMLIGMRQFVALSSGDKAGFQAAIVKEVEVKAGRMVRSFQRVNKMRAKFEAENASAGMYESSAENNAQQSVAPYASASNYSPAPQSGKVVNLSVAPGAVVVHGSAGDDSTHREAGEKLHRHVVRELARAAQQGGG
jgi:hypothetical protein